MVITVIITSATNTAEKNIIAISPKICGINLTNPSITG